MDLKTTYLGLELEHPLMPGASPLVDDLDRVKQLEDAGAAAIVMHSLFEEQVTGDQLGAMHHYLETSESFAEATSFMPPPADFTLGAEDYLEQIARIKKAVGVPVIGSLNGTTVSGWIEFARLIEQAGADALELNVYRIATDPSQTGTDIEDRLVEIVREVRTRLRIPLAVKLSPFYSSLANLAQRLDAAGADGLVLFNRFYQPDLDIEKLEVVPALELSTAAELRLRLQWLAILSGRVKASLAVSGGVHQAMDAVKAIMAGAHAVQLVSALLRLGPGHLKTLRAELVRWMEEHEYASIAQMRAALSLEHCPDPEAFARGNYLRVIHSWRF